MGKEDFSSWFSSKVDDVKEKNKDLTEYDITMNTIKHENMFKGTILICIVYAILGFILVVLSYVSESARDLLFNKFLPFTLVYIIGTIIIIFIMLYYIFTFEPVKINRHNHIDDISCPDYWDVKIIDEKYIGKSFDSNYTDEFKYQCVINNDIFDKTAMYKYHNNKNYRLTNNIAHTDNNASNVGKYLSSKEPDFANDYNVNSNKYNLYVDINKYSTDSTGAATATSNNQKYLGKELNIFNDSDRVKNIYSNLRKIAVIENNYAIDDTNKTAYSLTSRSNILNPDVKFSIWNKDNAATVATPVLSGTNAENALQIISWNDLKQTDFDIIFNNNSNINAIKVVVDDIGATRTSGTGYCLGLIEKDIENTDDIKYYFKQSETFQTELKTIFPPEYPGTSPVVKPSDVDAKNMIFKKTHLYATFKDPITKLSNSSNSYNINYASMTNYEYINKPGPIIQAYDKTKFRPDNISFTELNTDNIAPLLCDTVYPKLLSKFESYDIKNENNNDIRCAYSKICGIPWSDLRCPSNN
jgi:hypothetical protein